MFTPRREVVDRPQAEDFLVLLGDLGTVLDPEAEQLFQAKPVSGGVKPPLRLRIAGESTFSFTPEFATGLSAAGTFPSPIP